MCSSLNETSLAVSTTFEPVYKILMVGPFISTCYSSVPLQRTVCCLIVYE